MYDDVLRRGLHYCSTAVNVLKAGWISVLEGSTYAIIPATATIDYTRSPHDCIATASQYCRFEPGQHRRRQVYADLIKTTLTAGSLSSFAVLLAQAPLHLPPSCLPIAPSHRRDRLSSSGYSTGCPPTAPSAASGLLYPCVHHRHRHPRHHRPATDSPPR